MRNAKQELGTSMYLPCPFAIARRQASYVVSPLVPRILTPSETGQSCENMVDESILIASFFVASCFVVSLFASWYRRDPLVNLTPFRLRPFVADRLGWFSA